MVMQFKMAENGKQTITTYYLSMNDSLIKELQYNNIIIIDSLHKWSGWNLTNLTSGATPENINEMKWNENEIKVDWITTCA